jgi:hypothetical protein
MNDVDWAAHDVMLNVPRCASTPVDVARLLPHRRWTLPGRREMLPGRRETLPNCRLH